MEFFFYCDPDELKEVFSEVESLIDIAYQLHRLHVMWVKVIDEFMSAPLNSYKDFHNFGQIYPGNNGFLIYCPHDPIINVNFPPYLKFSGPPYSVADSRLICEGTLYLENKNPSYLNIYRTIRRCITKRFKKVGYAYLSTSVYEKRHEVIFLQQSANALTSPWYMDSNNQLHPIRINDYYEAQGETLEQRRHHDWAIYFFAYEEDLVEICGELEVEYNCNYIPCGKLQYQFTIQHSIHDLVKIENYRSGPWALYEQSYRLLLHLKVSGPKDGEDRLIEACKSFCVPNPFGTALYESFLSKIKERFCAVTASDGTIYYLSPRILSHRHEVVLKVGDSGFRIEGDNMVKV